MGGMACRKLRQIVANAQRVVAIELVTACQGVDFQGHRGLSPITRELYALLRHQVTPLGDDRVMYPDLDRAWDLITTGAVEQVLTPVLAASLQQ